MICPLVHLHAPTVASPSPVTSSSVNPRPTQAAWTRTAPWIPSWRAQTGRCSAACLTLVPWPELSHEAAPLLLWMDVFHGISYSAFLGLPGCFRKLWYVHGFLKVWFFGVLLDELPAMPGSPWVEANSWGQRLMFSQHLLCWLIKWGVRSLGDD